MENRHLRHPATPAKPETRSQTDGGTGTAERVMLSKYAFPTV
ncbi:hypothetical protein [Desulfothermus naphthae]